MESVIIRVSRLKIFSFDQRDEVKYLLPFAVHKTSRFLILEKSNKCFWEDELRTCLDLYCYT